MCLDWQGGAFTFAALRVQAVQPFLLPVDGSFKLFWLWHLAQTVCALSLQGSLLTVEWCWTGLLSRIKATVAVCDA